MVKIGTDTRKINRILLKKVENAGLWGKSIFNTKNIPAIIRNKLMKMYPVVVRKYDLNSRLKIANIRKPPSLE
jgi:hypothetical protein